MHDLQAVFQKLDSRRRDERHSGPQKQPLAPRHSKVRATDPDRVWQILALYAIAIVLVVLGFL